VRVDSKGESGAPCLEHRACTEATASGHVGGTLECDDYEQAGDRGGAGARAALACENRLQHGPWAPLRQITAVTALVRMRQGSVLQLACLAAGAAGLCVPAAGPATSRITRCAPGAGVARCAPGAGATALRKRMSCCGAAAASECAAAARESAMEVARCALVEATAAARFVARSYSAQFEEGTIGKSDASPVTVADFAVQAIVCARLLEAFPDDAIIAEEAADELRKNPELCERVLEAVRVAEPSATAQDICTWIDRGTERNYRERFWTLDPIGYDAYSYLSCS
jgi:hypothetical protein